MAIWCSRLWSKTDPVLHEDWAKADSSLVVSRSLSILVRTKRRNCEPSTRLAFFPISKNLKGNFSSTWAITDNFLFIYLFFFLVVYYFIGSHTRANLSWTWNSPFDSPPSNIAVALHRSSEGQVLKEAVCRVRSGFLAAFDSSEKGFPCRHTKMCDDKLHPLTTLWWVKSWFAFTWLYSKYVGW